MIELLLKVQIPRIVQHQLKRREMVRIHSSSSEATNEDNLVMGELNDLDEGDDNGVEEMIED